MKYDCELIKDITPLYIDGALSEKSKEIITEHLKNCESCRKYYDDFKDIFTDSLEQSTTEKENFSPIKKIQKYRIWQVAIFFISAIPLITMLFPWYGIVGLTEIKGILTFCHPFALVGLVLFYFGIWYNFKKTSSRFAFGYSGLGLIILSILYDFLVNPLDCTTGFQIGPFSIDLPYLNNISLVESISLALPFFYIGVVSFITICIVYYFFVKNNKAD